jgi:hypothetical protein
MVTSGAHGSPSLLLHATEMPLAQLKALDDHLLNDAVDPLVSACGGVAARRWMEDTNPPGAASSP